MIREFRSLRKRWKCRGSRGGPPGGLPGDVRGPDGRFGPKSSRFRGVCWKSRKRKWLAKLCVGPVEHNLGSFDEELDAALAYDDAAVRLLGDRARPNFPRPGPGRARSDEADEPSPRSRFRGVYWDWTKGAWQAQVWHAGRSHYAGRHADEEETARLYDRKALEVVGPGARLNFPAEEGGGR